MAFDSTYIPFSTELRAQTLNASVANRLDDAEAVLDQAIRVAFPGRIALVSSFGAEAAPLLHLVARVDRTTPVVFIDTGKHFGQTLDYRRSLAKELGLVNVRDITPQKDALEAEDPKGDLWRRDPDACCDLRKVRPLDNVLAGFDAWITGRKQFHGGDRMALPAFEASGDQIKVNPLARWSRERVDAYYKAHGIPRHPLVADGYPSIGCWPCTKPSDSKDPRAGRWAGMQKRECGIHRSAPAASETAAQPTAA
ncbi:MAG: phosphoadenylyl-sulfate reductase [Parvularculaceae bacterium]